MSELQKNEKLQAAEAEKAIAEAELTRVTTATKKLKLDAATLFQDREAALSIARAEAQLSKTRNEAARTEYEAKLAQLTFDINKRQDDREMAGDKYNRVYRFTAEVGDSSVYDCMATLTKWSRLEPQCPIEIVFCSPGGSIIEGFALYDFIQELKRKGHVITTKSIGYAASMAGVLMQSGSVRVMGKESWLLIHEASFLAFGKMGAVEDTVAWVKRMCERIVEIFAERAAEKTKKNQKQIATFIRKNWKRKDWWISSDEALRHGFCDRVE